MLEQVYNILFGFVPLLILLIVVYKAMSKENQKLREFYSTEMGFKIFCEQEITKRTYYENGGHKKK